MKQTFGFVLMLFWATETVGIEHYIPHTAPTTRKSMLMDDHDCFKEKPPWDELQLIPTDMTVRRYRPSTHFLPLHHMFKSIITPPPQLKERECGRRSYTEVDTATVNWDGGSESTTREWPWLVDIRVPRSADPYCTGILFTAQNILVPAHCLIGGHDYNFWPETKFVQVRLGDTYRSDKAPLPLHSYKRHEDFGWDDKVFFHDIAILKLAKPVEFSATVFPACLPFNKPLRYNNFNTKYGFLAGFGNSEKVRHKQTGVPHTIVSNLQCNHGIQPTGHVYSTNICSGGIYNEDDHTSEAGSSLVVKLNDSWYAVGMSSRPQPMNYNIRYHVPTLSTRLSEYIPWIEYYFR